MGSSRRYHPDYRQTEVSAIVQALDSGNSVSVLGPPSIGKSNLQLFLGQERWSPDDPNNPWVRYAPQSASQGPIIAITIDPNALLPSLPGETGNVASEAWPGFELLTHRTSITPALRPIYRPPQDDDPNPEISERVERLRDRFESAHTELTDFRDHLHAHLALRHLEEILYATLTAAEIQGRPIRIAYFLDEFERVLDTMPDYFFVALRSIRDRFKYKIMFVTFTRNTLTYLVSKKRLAALEPFLELFHDRTVYLRPFADDDAWRMVEQLEERMVSKDDYALGLLIRATGGFAGLLRAGFQHVDRLLAVTNPEYPKAVEMAAEILAQQPNVQAECETLLRGLNSREITTIYGVVTNKPDLSTEVIQELLNKALLAPGPHGQGLRIIPPLLFAHVRRNPTPPEARPSPPPVTLPPDVPR
jgi:hypothetical protein